jgi:predicted nucleic acid-binding protein
MTFLLDVTFLIALIDPTHVSHSPAVVADVLARFTGRRGHVFWPDDVSLLDGRYVDTGKLLTAGQVTDTYLLALAVAHGGQLASLDRRLSVAAVHGGKAGLHLI